MPESSRVSIQGILSFSRAMGGAIITYNPDGPPPVIVEARPVRAGQMIRDAFPDGVENPNNYKSKGIGATVSTVVRQWKRNGGAWQSE
jgi:hypothetical protein